MHALLLARGQGALCEGFAGRTHPGPYERARAQPARRAARRARRDRGTLLSHDGEASRRSPADGAGSGRLARVVADRDGRCGRPTAAGTAPAPFAPTHRCRHDRQRRNASPLWRFRRAANRDRNTLSRHPERVWQRGRQWVWRELREWPGQQFSDRCGTAVGR